MAFMKQDFEDLIQRLENFLYPKQATNDLGQCLQYPRRKVGEKIETH